jgi:hypothetical protein
MIDDTPMRGPVLIANDVVSPREFAVLSGIAQCTYTKFGKRDRHCGQSQLYH